MTLTGVAFREGWSSGVASGEYRVGVMAPVMTPPGGAYTHPVWVTIQTATPGATLRYTTDGGDPTSASAAIGSGGRVRVDRTLTLKARGFLEGIAESAAASETYRFNIPAPTLIEERTGSSGSPLYVRGATALAGAAVRCTLDGSEPHTSSPICMLPFPISESTTVKAKAFHTNLGASATVQRSFVVTDTAPIAPALNPEGGSYFTRQEVRVTTPSPGAVVRYTTDGSAPSEASPLLPASGVVGIEGSLTLKARAWVGTAPSLVARADYLLTGAVTVVEADPPSAGAAAPKTVVALKTDGTILAWGANACGQIGDGSLVSSTSPIQTTIAGVTAIASGRGNTIALRADGTVWGWGANHRGQVGIGDLTRSCVASPTSLGLTNIIAIAAGDYFGAALASDGSLWVWGDAAPWLPIEERTRRSSPQHRTDVRCSRIFANGENLVCIDAGEAFYITSAWGPPQRKDDLGVAGLGRGVALFTRGGRKGLIGFLDSTTSWLTGPPPASTFAHNMLIGDAAGAIAATDPPLADSGYGVGWIPSSSPLALVEASPAVAVAPWSVVRANGTLWRWGLNASGELGDGTTEARSELAMVPGLQLFDDAWPLLDPDGDGLTNVEELDLGTDPLQVDTNGDGVPDGALATGRDPVSADLDGDGLSNAEERARGLDPLLADTDGDGVNDGQDVFPRDPSRWEPPPADPGDTTPPNITLASPRNATLVSSTP
jgi:hypothetical protein